MQVIPSKRKICKYYVNTGKCPKKNFCNFAHIDDVQHKQEYLQSKKQNRCHLGVDETHVNEDSSEWKEHENSSISDEFLGSRHARARIFANWLVAKFFHINAQPGLKTKMVVYDVAGGKGEVTFELNVRHRDGINRNCHFVIVDLRKPEKFESGALPRWQRKMIKVRQLRLLKNKAMAGF